jgi:hypothetical protein
MKILDNQRHLGSQMLKEQYLQCFGERASNAAALQAVVRDLINEGIPRKTLVGWAVDTGFSKGHAASVLSRIFVALGLRERKRGAGRKPSPAALELLDHVRSRYGENFLRVLYAACRAGRVQLSAARTPDETGQPRLKPNCASAISPDTRPVVRISVRRKRSASIIFK